VSTSYDDSLKIWKEDSDDDWHCVQTLHGHSSTVWAADFDSSGELIASVGDDKILYLWKRNSDRSSLDMYLEYAIFPDLHSRTIYSVSFKFPYIATCGGDNCIKIIEICEEQDTEVKIVERHKIQDAHGKSDVNSVVWCEIEGFRDYLCSAGDDRNIKIWQCPWAGNKSPF
jgi:cytosolic iron-sulfur protein assembly protein CIAO1